MSIIFDALKKAEASRQRGQSPGLHSPQLRTGTGSAPASKLRVFTLAGLFLACGIGAYWSYARRDQGAAAVAEGNSPGNSGAPVSTAAPGTGPGMIPGTPTASVPSSAGIPPASAMPPASAEMLPMVDLTQAGQATGGPQPDNAASPQVAQSAIGQITNQTAVLPSLAKPLTGNASVTTPIPTAPIASGNAELDAERARAKEKVMAEMRSQAEAARLDAQASQQAQAEAAQVEAARAATMPASSNNTPVASMPLTPPAEAPAASGGLPMYFELPYEVRHGLPKMNVSMHVYNAAAQKRFVIVNGKRHVEGDQIEGGVTIRGIRAEGMECEFQGTAFFYPRTN
jgi:general secretion pathway protein B